MTSFKKLTRQFWRDSRVLFGGLFIAMGTIIGYILNIFLSSFDQTLQLDGIVIYGTQAFQSDEVFSKYFFVIGIAFAFSLLCFSILVYDFMRRSFAPKDVPDRYLTVLVFSFYALIYAIPFVLAYFTVKNVIPISINLPYVLAQETIKQWRLSGRWFVTLVRDENQKYACLFLMHDIKSPTPKHYFGFKFIDKKMFILIVNKKRELIVSDNIDLYINNTKIGSYPTLPTNDRSEYHAVMSSLTESDVKKIFDIIAIGVDGKFLLKNLIYPYSASNIKSAMSDFSDCKSLKEHL